MRHECMKGFQKARGQKSAKCGRKDRGVARGRWENQARPGKTKVALQWRGPHRQSNRHIAATFLSQPWRSMGMTKSTTTLLFPGPGMHGAEPLHKPKALLGRPGLGVQTNIQQVGDRRGRRAQRGPKKKRGLTEATGPNEHTRCSLQHTKGLSPNLRGGALGAGCQRRDQGKYMCHTQYPGWWTASHTPTPCRGGQHGAVGWR